MSALYILLGVLVVAVVSLQVWIARSGELTGSRSGVVFALRAFNVAALITAVALVVYFLARR